MLKKIGLPAMILAAMAFVTPTSASAQVHFGIYVGPPAYVYPADPYYGYYADPYAYGYPYYYSHPYPYTYAYPAPGYAAPYFSFGWGGHHDRHEWAEHGRREFYEHGRRGRGHGFGR